MRTGFQRMVLISGSLLSYLRENKLITSNIQIMLDMATQVAAAMGYLENFCFIHRDLAARNCLVGDRYLVKVADFGLTRYVVDDTYTASEGSKFPIKWAAPEVINYARFSSKSDIWSYGILLWELFTGGITPYKSFPTHQLMLEQILKGYRLEQPPTCPNHIYEIMLSCWLQSPESRPSFNTVDKNLRRHIRNTMNRTLPRNAAGASVCNPTASTFQSKPRLVGMLEEYLERELKILGKNISKPNSARLQAHKEVFEHLIGEFHSFKPILSAIKQEYDSYISNLEEQVDQLDPLKLKLQLISEENEKKFLVIQNEEKHDVQNLETETASLKSTIHHMEEAIATLEAKVLCLQSELSAQYILYRNEADAKKIAISDLSQLKKTQQQPDDNIAQKEDPIVLRIALKQCREDLKLSQRKLTQIIADYGDVIPRKEFEDLHSQFEITKDSFEELKQDFTTLNMERDLLDESYKEAVLAKSNISKDLERLKGNATPRPQWDHCARFFEDGKWAGLTEDTSSAEKVDFLLVEMSGLSLEEVRASDMFQGLGTEDHIPKFLRCDGQIKNTHMKKQEAYKILSAYWPYRVQQLVNNDNVPFDVSLYTYLSEIQSEERVYETAYNIHQTLSQYEFQLLPGLFLSVILGKKEEEIYFELLARHDILKSQIYNLATTEEEGYAKISQDNLVNCILSNFSVFTEDMAVKLTNSIVESDGIVVDELAKQLGEGASEFVERFYEVFLEQREVLIKDITIKLEGFETVSVDDFVITLKNLDPSQPEKKLSQLLRFIFSIPNKSVDSISGTRTESVQTVLSLLSQSAIMRS
ncbi:Translin-associated factor X-interacting protein 1-like [Oopsacas minuta]|uniref:Translin-associated factor X-interacting protein 1-like n=1 Tax=Oopsacas minuta TaxID=111878 RepID=A0AAV7JEF8_9METZ|nr:Translin-associated factor X-interacting protein 1-like [Oopsacas minuta]